MRYTTLATVQHRITVGAPLPFNVYDADRTLLLARRHRVESTQQLAALCARGTLVDLDELLSATERAAQAPLEELPRLWTACLDTVGRVLADSSAPTFRGALDEAAEPVAALIDRDPDLAIFQVLRQDDNPHRQYGIHHSVHTAIIARLVAQRLAWPQQNMVSAFKAALTMNLAMLELQGQLAEQRTPLTEAQRLAVREHPQRAVEMLQQAGITDGEWLSAVAQHHEERDGSGYPNAIRNPSELAMLLHRADVYAAKLSARATRQAKAADEAGREIFRQDPGHPITAALVKEFGIYPPGTFVALASGETGIVVRRGPTVMTPVVAALTTLYGDALAQPQRRDTSQPLYAIVGVLPARQMRVRAVPAQLLALAA